MSRRDPNVLYDGVSTILRGVNSGLAPISLGRDQLAWAINTTFRNNYATSRPGFVKRALRFTTSWFNTHTSQQVTLNPDPVLKSNFQSAIFQGAIAFERRNQIVAVIGGHIFSIDLASGQYNVLDVSPVLS